MLDSFKQDARRVNYLDSFRRNFTTESPVLRLVCGNYPISMDCDGETSTLAFAELLDVFSDGFQFFDSDNVEAMQ